MRIAACHLYANIYPKLDEAKMENSRNKFTKLVKDDTPMVRWGAAQAMAELAQHLSKEQIGDFLLPLLKDLLQDKNDSVKVHAVQSSVTIARLIKSPEKVAANVLPSLK